MSKVTKERIEAIMYEWVVDSFGESEALDPSWNTEALAEYVAEKLNDPNYKPKYQPKYTIN